MEYVLLAQQSAIAHNVSQETVDILHQEGEREII